MKNVILLGGSGYVGRNLIEQWLRSDPEVNVISLSRNGKPNNISSYLEQSSRIQWLAVDVFDSNSFLHMLPSDVEVIIDLIGTATADTYEEFEKVNVGPVNTMIDIMDKLFIEQGGYVSGVIGMPFKNKPFVKSKAMAEAVIAKSGKNIKIFKPSLIYGDRPEVAMMVPFMKMMGKLPGKQNYTPIKIEDLTKDMILSYKM